MVKTRVHYVVIEDPNTIFGSVGRCGSGYNTKWADWTQGGRENIQRINEEWYERYDKITGHYSKLEESILKEGFRNPPILTCGHPYNRDQSFIPPEFRSKKDLLIMDGYDGGSRLWVAQKHNIPVPAIINDHSGKYAEYPEIFCNRDLLRYFKDPPEYINFSSNGVVCTKVRHSHMDNEFIDPEKQAAQIIPLWVELLKKYGYTPNVRSMHRKYLKGYKRNRNERRKVNISKNFFKTKQPARVDEKVDKKIYPVVRTRGDIKPLERINKPFKEIIGESLRKFEEVNPLEWNGTAYVVAGGPSLRNFNWGFLDKGKFVVAINQSHRMLPSAQIVYFTDKKYWEENKHSLMDHEGILIKGTLNPKKEENLERIILMHLSGPNGLEKRKGMLKHGSNSTYAVINMLAVHLKFKKIYLMGVDMSWGKKGDKETSHWHEGYKRLTPESSYKRMRSNFSTLVQPLRKMGVEVINLINPNCPSELRCFKEKTIKEIFGE